MRENIDSTNDFSFDLINPECSWNSLELTKIMKNIDISQATQ